MAFGIEIYNPNGDLVLGEGVTNYFCIGSGSVATSSAGAQYLDGGDKLWQSVNISPGVYFDAVAILSPDTFARLYDPFPGPVNTFNLGYYNRWTTGGSAGVIYYWLFREYGALSPSTSGMDIEVYRADGSVAFSTKQPKILKHKTEIVIPSLSDASSNTYSIPVDGRTYAYMRRDRTIINGHFTTGGHGGTDHDCYQELGLKSFSDHIEVQACGRWGRRLSASERFGSVVLVDVTGY